jgi:hypothetical protein
LEIEEERGLAVVEPMTCGERIVHIRIRIEVSVLLFYCGCSPSPCVKSIVRKFLPYYYGYDRLQCKWYVGG